MLNLIGNRFNKIRQPNYKSLEQRVLGLKGYAGYQGSGSYPLGFPSGDLERSKAGAAASYAFVSEVHNCISSLVSGIKNLPWEIRRYEEGVRKKPGEQIESIVLASSNDLQVRHPMQKAFVQFQIDNDFGLLETMAFDYKLYGMVALEVVDNIFGYNAKIEWLNPLGFDVFAIQEIEHFRYGWNNRYVTYDPEEISYIHNRNVYDDFTAYPEVLAALDKINILMNADRFLRGYFWNNARPSLIIMPPDNETNFSEADHAVIKQEIRDALKGPTGQYRTTIFQRALQTVSLEQPDLTRNHQLTRDQSDAIYEKFSVPRALRGNTDTTSYKESGVVHRFYLDAIIPLSKVLQEFINTELMPIYSKDIGFEAFEFDTSAFDLVTEADQLEATVVNSQVTGGYVTLAQAQRIQERPVDKSLEGRYMYRGLPMRIDQIDRMIEAEITNAESFGQQSGGINTGGGLLGPPENPKPPGGGMLPAPKPNPKPEELAAKAANFEESEHPRDESGEFAPAEGGEGEEAEERETSETETEIEETSKPPSGESNAGTEFIPRDTVRDQKEAPMDATNSAKDFQWQQSLSSEEQQGLENWRTNDWDTYQALDRGETEGVSSETKQDFENFKSAVDRAPEYKGVSWRGKRARGGDFDSNLKEFQDHIGDTMNFETHASASGSSEVAGQFARIDDVNRPSILFEIHSKNGKYINSVSPTAFTQDDEFELIFTPDSKFIIKDAFAGKAKGLREEQDAIFVVLEDKE